MSDFKEMYFHLVHLAEKIGDTAALLADLSNQLRDIQRQGEEMYVEETPDDAEPGSSADL